VPEAPSKPKRPSEARAIRAANAADSALLILTSLIFASAFLAIKKANESFTAPAIAGGRTLIGAALTLGFVASKPNLRGQLGAALSNPRVALVGLAGYAVPFALIALAEQHISAGLAGLLVSTGPIFGLLLAPLFVKDESITPRRLLGVVVGGCGAALAILMNRHTSGSFAPALLVVGAAGLYAVAGFTARRIAAAPDVVTLGALVWALGALAPAVFVAGVSTAPVAAEPLSSLLYLIYLGVGPTAIGYLIRFRQIAQLGYGFVSYTGYLVPVASLSLGAIFFNEKLHPSYLAALTLVLVALAIGRKRR